MRQLLTVLKVEQNKEEQASRALQLAQSNVQQQQQKLNSLDQYRLNYLREMQDNARQGLGAKDYTQHLAFIGKLDLAIVQQTKILAQARGVEQQRKQQWLAQRQRRMSVEFLLDKKRQEIAKKEAKAEQAMLDEFATQKFFRNKNSGFAV